MLTWTEGLHGAASECGRFLIHHSPKGWTALRLSAAAPPSLSGAIVAESPLYRSDEAARAWCEGMAWELDEADDDEPEEPTPVEAERVEIPF